MTTQLLIYESTAPITKGRHGNWSVKSGTDYSFARRVNAVPLAAVEFTAVASEYTIVFAGEGDKIMPAIILGVHDQENVYLSESGDWQAKYVPAFLRRYPFVFSSDNDGKTFTLCIDEKFSGCNQEGRGERLFDTEGEQTQYLKNILTFLTEYQAHFRRTQAFCNKLKELDLLEPMQAQFTLGTGERGALAGFLAVDRQRLKGLKGDKLEQLAQTDELELAYLHLHSLRNFPSIVERVAPPAAAPPDQDTMGMPTVGASDTRPDASKAKSKPKAKEKGNSDA